MLCRWPAGVAADALKAYGGDPLGLWGETDPMNFCSGLDCCRTRHLAQAGREHASAMCSLSWRESMLAAVAGGACTRDCTTSTPGFGASDHARFLSL